MNFALQSIVHPTDFSDLSARAFAHALRIAIAAKSALHALHVEPQQRGEAGAFPQVRRMLTQWGFIGEHETAPEIAAKLGFLVSNIRIDGSSPAQAILDFLDKHATDLLVLGTHGRDGLERLLVGSVAETVSRRSSIPTLFVGSSARTFVSEVSGDMTLRRVLIPVDYSPAPARSVEAVRRFALTLTGTDTGFFLLHIGSSAPEIFTASPALEFPQPVILRSGPVVRSILDAADEFEVDLIAMPTAGHHGVLDALRGSTTERVLRNAPCPVLAVPA
jgi:nucleotide-binding universal stress UspA family protein